MDDDARRAAGNARRREVLGNAYVDAKLPKDVTSIAISYTFFEVAGRAGKG